MGAVRHGDDGIAGAHVPRTVLRRAARHHHNSVAPVGPSPNSSLPGTHANHVLRFIRFVRMAQGIERVDEEDCCRLEEAGEGWEDQRWGEALTACGHDSVGHFPVAVLECVMVVFRSVLSVNFQSGWFLLRSGFVFMSSMYLFYVAWESTIYSLSFSFALT